ncbi:MAG: adenine phosphoribosyltransferase [Elusimicrobia bacterium]|nr:adenine phosphoribosyltransferase [Elusimicrobiota bacterium]
MTAVQAPDLKHWVTDVPDFPKKGIVFKDITPLLGDPGAFKATIDALAGPFESLGVQQVAGVESRGFLLAAAIAQKLGAGLIPIRKKGKLPRKTVQAEYALEYGTDSVECHADAASPGARVLLVDDVLATGGTAAASARLLETVGAKIVGVAFLIELDFLKGREKLKSQRVHSVLHY